MDASEEFGVSGLVDSCEAVFAVDWGMYLLPPVKGSAYWASGFVTGADWEFFIIKFATYKWK